MRQSFLGVTVDVPESWSNRSLALFASPPAEESGPALPTLHRQRRGPAMSVTVTPPTALDSGESAETKLKTTLARLQGGSGLRIQSTGNETCGQHTIAWAACASKASDGRSVGQLIAVVGNERLTVGFSGSVALADFPRTQATLWEILRSIKLDP